MVDAGWNAISQQKSHIKEIFDGESVTVSKASSKTQVLPRKLNLGALNLLLFGW